MMNTFLAVIGPEALWLTFVWLASAIVASILSQREGLRREARVSSPA